MWDTKLVSSGEELARRRVELVDQITPLVTVAYAEVAGPANIDLQYQAPWREKGLFEALGELRRDELRRGITLVGPHRDDLMILLDALPGPIRRRGSSVLLHWLCAWQRIGW